MRPLLLLAFALFVYGQEAAAPEKKPAPPPPPPPYDQARPLIVSQYGIVAASNFLASQAGARILEQGGNAIDAAIAANAMTGLTQPFVNGIGGDLFAIYYEAKTGKVYGLNASGWTPKALTVDYLAGKGIAKLDATGVHTITVPGAVAGWQALLKRFGTKTMREVLAPAIHHAEQGFPLSLVSARSIVNQRLLKQPGFKETYAVLGEKPTVGELFKNPGLGESLRMVAARGADGFYKGKLAETMVKFLNEQGGAHTLEDFAEYQPEWVEPISTTYRDWKIYELPPNGQGIAALAMLNIMERFPLKEYGHNSAAALHVAIEAKKLAYADMAKYVGDPRFGAIPVEEMLSKALAERRAGLIQMDKAACQVLPTEISQNLDKRGRETIYLSTIDKDGNIVSLIQSNYAGFGTGMVAPGTGFSFHNRGAGFDLKPGQPNTIEGRKRPLHTIIPAFMQKGDVKIGFGIMGGWNQSQAHAQFVSNVVDFGMNVQQAIEAARFTKLTFEGCDVQIEGRVDEATRLDLRRRGHVISVSPNYSSGMGFGSAVQRDEKKKVNLSGTDPRVDGAAIPQLPVYK
ncbi:MAG: gamma-glutamyltransferase [Bryobacter sp.]|nr:gamma-glutamyltransferase [Bryobacter sp.]